MLTELKKACPQKSDRRRILAFSGVTCVTLQASCSAAEYGSRRIHEGMSDDYAGDTQKSSLTTELFRPFLWVFIYFSNEFVCSGGDVDCPVDLPAVRQQNALD